MEDDTAAALAHLIKIQSKGGESFSQSLDDLLEQHALHAKYEDQRAVLVSIDYMIDSNNLQDIEPGLISKVVSQVCMPQAVSVLHKIQQSEGEYTAEAISECTLSILEKCLPVCPSAEAKTELLTVATSVLSAVFVSSDGSYASEPWARGLRCVSRLTAAAVASLSDSALLPHLPDLATALSGLISSSRAAAALAGVSTLGPLLLSRLGFGTAHADQLWTLLRPADGADLARCLAAACALADHLLPHPPDHLWSLLGRGLAADDPLLRKRARYLLQRAVETRRATGGDSDCSWLPWRAASARRAAPLWDDLALLLETLEGKQVHLIRPVMTKLDALLANTALVPLFWSLCVLRRAFRHGNGFVVRWGVLRALDLPPVDDTETFVTAALVPALNDAALFSDVDLQAVLSSWEPAASGERYQCDSLPPPTETGRRLRSFLGEYLSGEALPRRAAALTAALADQSWSSVALLHVAHALPGVQVGRCLDAAAALALCRSLSERLAAQEAVLRLASRRLLLRVALGWLRPDAPALECAVAAAAADGTSAPVGLAAPDPMALRAEMTAALAAERGPARGRLLGSALRVLAATLPLDGDHPVLPPLRAALSECHSDVYRPRAAVVSDIALLAALAGLANPSHRGEPVPDAVRELIAQLTPSVGEFVVRQAESAATAEDLTLCEFYAEFLRAAAAAGSTGDLTTIMRRLCDISDSEHPLRVHSSVVILSGVTGALGLTLATAGDLGGALMTLVTLARHHSVPAALSAAPGAGTCDTPLAARHVEATWRLTGTLLSAGVVPEADQRQAAPAAVAALSVCPRRGLVPLLGCLRALLTGAGPELLREAAAAAWSALHEHRRSEVFVQSLPGLARLVFTAETLSDPDLSDLLQDMSDRLIQLSESVPAALFSLISQLTTVWSSDHSSLPRHLPAVSAALLHGAVHRRDRRALQDTVGFVSGPAAPPTADHLLERAVRAAGVRALRQMALGGRREAVVELAAELGRRADRAGEGRHFGNSASHRLQQRAYQALLVLHTALPQEEQERLCAATCDRLLRCHPQPSVRYLQEWLVICLCLQQPQLTQRVWHHMEKAGEGRTGSIGSFVAILTHLAQAGPPGSSGDGDAAEQFVRLCFRRVLPWCMAQHFNTRVYAQAALHRLWLLAEKRGMSAILSEFEVVHDSVAQSLEHGNANKNSQLILNDFYFTVFDPVRHYSLEAIYSSVPRLASVDQDEWVPTELFAADVADEGGPEGCPAGLPRLTLLCPGLRDARPATWTARTADLRTPTTGDGPGPADPTADPPSSAGGGGEVQRKPTPWRQLLPDSAELAALQRRRRPAGAADTSLVLVASLVDRPPNLGGLCRTCEVLGAAEMVLPSLQLAADKQFQNLSVSAERWVPLTEVKPHQLAGYLAQKRSAGYTLVGVEQTSGSVPVTEYQFPERTLLLLGNEREGVPVELIHLLDVCLEIPQRGVVRSLNVHVAGALLLWEYRRQHP